MCVSENDGEPDNGLLRHVMGGKQASDSVARTPRVLADPPSS